MTPTAFHISGVNGIADLTVQLDGPGVFVARGPNGAGKSSAIEALRAASGDTTAKAEPTDGEDKGTVQATGGVILAVGHRRRLNGAPCVRLVSPGAIGTLIDPGIKDPNLAARARLKALLSLMPLPADEAARQALTKNDPELQAWIKGDPSTDAMELAEAIRKRANELANDLEKKSAEAKGEEASLINLILELGALDFEAGEFATAQAEATRLATEAQVKAHTAKQRVALEFQQSQIRQSMGERPNVGIAAAAMDVANEHVVNLERQLAVAREKAAAATRDWTKAKAEQAEWDSRAEIMKQKPEGPTVEEANEAADRANGAQARADRARKLETAKGYQIKANAAKEVSRTAADRAKALRDIAQGTADALGQLLERRGLPGLVVTEGRLAVRAGDKIKDFDTRLSFGERVRTALGVALAGITAPANENRLPVLALEPAFWLALDREHKAEVCTIARERGVCLVTEEPDNGPLRFEPLRN